MKLVKIFGVVMAVHAAVFMFIFAIPGCRSTGKKTAAAAPVIGSESSPLASSESFSPVGAEPAPSSEVAAIRFSPTRPGTPAAVEAVATPPPATYTVVKGDSLWSISRKHGITVKQLTAVNNLRSDSTLKLGQTLVLPGKASSAPVAASSAVSVAPVASAVSTSKTSITHVVKSGETLGGIAKKYQVKVGEIATANNIADPTKIRVGQSLKIPGWQAPASKSAAPAAVTPSIAPVPEPVAPVSPIFSSPLMESAPISAPVGESPLITPAPESTDAPLIRVEESGAPKIE